MRGDGRTVVLTAGRGFQRERREPRQRESSREESHGVKATGHHPLKNPPSNQSQSR